LEKLWLEELIGGKIIMKLKTTTVLLFIYLLGVMLTLPGSAYAASYFPRL
jgi:hypothetical protein